ncbi:hypothetical protein [Dyella terrae]|uniref:DUF4850 domain-containing protein n=1 Tax=Dyella terrae TaxID=522259 RepID=A0ABY1YS74_9GAMM|nr:hypothetical protein [Dyella terrae]TBR36543.1 hypothetical protein EYV96_11445 [Dyella terrae]
MFRIMAFVLLACAAMASAGMPRKKASSPPKTSGWEPHLVEGVDYRQADITALDHDGHPLTALPATRIDINQAYPGDVAEWDDPSRAIPRLPVDLPLALQARLRLFTDGSSWFAVPRDWRLKFAMLTGDTTLFYVFEPATGRPGRAQFVEYIACAGCAISAAASVHPNARQAYRELTGESPDKPDRRIKTTFTQPCIATQTWPVRHGMRKHVVSRYENDGPLYTAFTVELPDESGVPVDAMLDVFRATLPGCDTRASDPT